MAKSTMNKLEQENKALRALSIKLGRIVLNSVDAIAVVFNSGNDNMRVPMFKTHTPDQIVSALRDIAIECGHLARNSANSGTHADLEEISVELADKAANLEGVFRIPAGPK